MMDWLDTFPLHPDWLQPTASATTATPAIYGKHDWLWSYWTLGEWFLSSGEVGLGFPTGEDESFRMEATSRPSTGNRSWEWAKEFGDDQTTHRHLRLVVFQGCWTYLQFYDYSFWLFLLLLSLLLLSRITMMMIIIFLIIKHISITMIMSISCMSSMASCSAQFLVGRSLAPVTRRLHQLISLRSRIEWTTSLEQWNMLEPVRLCWLRCDN